MQILVLNGPNLNLLGTREPEVYGTTSLQDLEKQIESWAMSLGVAASFVQTNHEGDLIDAIHGASDMDGIIINPGALTHTSRSIGDAIGSVGVPAVEVHISNIKRRESWRSVSFVSDAAIRTMYGRGMTGYRDALRHLVNRAAGPFETVRYGPHRDNIADVRLPSADPSGLVVLVHGGFWMMEWERDSMETLAVDLTAKGFATMNLEYRRLGDGGGWPGSAHDVLTALALVDESSALSDLPRGMIGHSAGGHLALWSAPRRQVGRIGLTVGLAPVTDLAALAGADGAGSQSAQALLGSGAPTEVGAVPGKTLLIHGTVDDLVPVSHSTRLESEATVVIVEDLGHFEMLDPTRSHWARVVDSLGEALV